ncbi:hypothetical protein [Phenylobacterium sp.]|jgi:hypothetical protein|uniref:hypothetical protein n=1 Tax=Phenylobacterium sp. TaxID=1871053 RepID=UPI002E30C899|nr:hypothetical protein [Phenylobacterium sp.]HEX4711201.1 hypothetical protein [Phenylobacterium sp.]
MSQPPDDHLKALWKGQETETTPMSVDAVRTRAARFTARRRATYLVGLAVMLAEIVIFGRYALLLPGVGLRAGMLATLVGLGWMIAFLTVRRPGRLPDAKTSGADILEFHRTELQRQRTTFGDLLVMVGPVLAGMLIFVVAAIFSGRHLSRGLLNAAPLLGLIGLWLVAAWWFARRQERRRLRQLAEIDATRLD